MVQRLLDPMRNTTTAIVANPDSKSAREPMSFFFRWNASGIMCNMVTNMNTPAEKANARPVTLLSTSPRMKYETMAATGVIKQNDVR